MEDSIPQIHPNDNQMGAAALAYVQRGIYVFPVHVPVFDDVGDCIGCTCEDYRWSDACKNNPKHDYMYLAPGQHCEQPGKCPAVAWGSRSTVDATQIGKWFRPWLTHSATPGVRYTPNIGVDAGKSNLVIPDFDTYKAGYAGDPLLAKLLAASPTVIDLTPSGGKHFWYGQPPGKKYGNATGNLPYGVDMRGHGGYIVAWPSLHKSGRRYEFLPGHSPAEIAVAPLPALLIDALDAAQSAQDAPHVTFTAHHAPLPDLTRWWLSADVLELIHHGAPKGERSEADFRVMLALAREGASDDDIRAVFTHFAIGAKYDERGDKYLAHSIGNARRWLADHPPDPPADAAKLTELRSWVLTPACIEHLRAKLGKCRAADIIIFLHTLVDMAQTRRSTRVTTTVRDLGIACAVSHPTAWRRLQKVIMAELVTVTTGDYGSTIDLAPALNHLELTETLLTLQESVSVNSTSNDAFVTEHRIDDTFASYPYTYAIKRRNAPTVLLQSLGASALLLWPALADGGTVTELAAARGLTVSCVRATLKRVNQAGLLVVWEGRAKSYELHPNAEELLEDRREHMTTAGIGQLRVARNHAAIGTYAQQRLTGRMQLDPGHRARLEQRRETNDGLALTMYESLALQGINPHARVAGYRQPRPPGLHLDPMEEWHSWGRDLWEVWRLLGDDSEQDKLRLLTIAEIGENASDAVYRATYREVRERVELALRLAPQRVKWEQPYWHPDLAEAPIVAPLPPTPLTLFEVAA
jgi:DNA-binding IscR family transcriptional regulator